MKKNSAKTAGYTLIEMSMVLLVVGVLISTFTMGYTIHIKRVTTDATASNMAQVTNALGNFLIQQGRYPCPARADVDRSSPDYGIEGDCTDTSVAVGDCAAGICIEQSARAMGSSAIIAILKPGIGMTPAYTATNWVCGTVPCNYAEYLMHLYTNKPSVYCPLPTSVVEYSNGGIPYDVCTVPGMVGYFNSFYPDWLDEDMGTAAGGGSQARVRRGSVPFRTLNIPEKSMVDGYRMRLDYAVTEALAVAESYKKDNGGISIVDHNDKSLVTPDASAHFAIISHGEDRKGGYNQQGVQYGACPTGQMDGANCDTATDDLAIYRAAPIAKTTSPAYYDDLVQYYTAVETPLWKVADSDGFNIHDLVNAGLPGGGKVGIGSDTPTAAVEVGGGGRIISEKLMVSEICNDSSKCYAAAAIAGNEAAMDCTDTNHPDYDAAKPYMVGIADGKAVCAATVDFKCPAGSLMKGVNADGTLVCMTTVTCPATPVTLCAPNDATLTGSLVGQTRTVSAGTTGTRTLTSTCTATGTWSNTTVYSGPCSCTATVSNTPKTCVSIKGTGAGTWIKNGIKTVTTACPSGAVTTTYNTAACECSGSGMSSSPSTFSCGAGFTSGHIKKKQTWTCSSTTAGAWSAPFVSSNTCTCTPQTLTQSLTCPTAYTGIWTQRKTLSCPGGSSTAGTWSGWVDDVKTCACTGSSETQTVPCGSGLLGNKTRTRTYDCPADVWGAWMDTDVSQCLAVTYKWAAKSAASPSGIKGPGAQLNTACTVLSSEQPPCWGYNAGVGYDNYPACACE